jgi:SAM-dependent methyltransferase
VLKGRGDFYRLQTLDGSLEISGWIFDPDVPSETIRIFVDGAARAEQTPTRREDVGGAFPWIRHAGLSGFRFLLPRPDARCVVDIAAFGRGRELVRIRSTFAPEFEGLPVPGPALLTHILPGPDPHLYHASSLFSFASYESALIRHVDLSTRPRVLDWGCGSGRLSRLFLKIRPGPEVFGCDIDGDAIAWCRENLSDGQFAHTGPQPPLPYSDGFFAAVVAHSVFTHLTRENQFVWLAEMRRILAPGGFLIASINGPLVASCVFRGPEPSRLARLLGRFGAPLVLKGVLKDGFFDSGEDRALAGVAPDGYYRGFFQTPGWTRREWSRFLEVVELREGGVNNHQDLVVLRRP